MQYRFGVYHLDTQRYELHHAGVLVPLRPKVFQVLAYLVAQHDRVVRKEELLEAVWPGQFVGDVGLNTYIMEVRKALEDRRPPHQYLRTVRGQGYRFVAPVTTHDHAPPPSPRPAEPLPGLEVPTRTPPASAVALSTVGGAALTEPPRLQADGEYKPVSVLCGGLRDAAVLAAGLDAEGLYRVLQTVVALAYEVIQTYGGTLTQQTLEGVTAVFGVPVAQEDHARRAVLAALDLQQRLAQHPTLHSPALGAGLALGIGIHSGLGVVGEMGSVAHRQVTAVGAPAQGALRLQQQATPGTLLVSAATWGLVQDEVQGALYGSLTLDGEQAPLPVYAVRGLVRRRAGVPQRGPQSSSPFVGRQPELALLQDRLEAVQAGHGQVVSLSGPPGIGKTRLLTDFGRRLALGQVTWVLGQCLPYGQAMPYLPVRDIVQHLCSIAEGDPLETRTAAVRQRLAALGEVTEVDVALVLQLLDVPVVPEFLEQLTPEARQAQTFGLLGHLIRHEAQRQPLVLAVENVHWIDPTSAAWLGSFIDRLPGMAVLLLLTQRPGSPPLWGDHAAVTQLALPPLGAKDSQAIVAAVPGTAQLSTAQCQQIVAQATGNPFFVEELAWHAVEHGQASLPVPETVHAVLAARLDHLTLEEKRLVQTAAVIGMDVPYTLLRALVDVPEATLQRRLARLYAAEFLCETRLSPEPDSTFKHALTHEVAYNSLLQERRRVLHARLVEILEAPAPDRAVERIERLAHHALRGEVWDKALAYCQQAGTRAADRAAFREAVTAFEQALQALDHLPESGDTWGQAIDLHLAMAVPLSALGEHGRCLALLDKAEALARALDDRARLGQVLARMAGERRVTGDLDGAIAAGRQALALAADLGASALQAEASFTLGRAYFSSNDFGRAAELLWRNVEATDREAGVSSIEVRIRSQAWLALTLSELGAFAEGRRHGEEALRLAMLEGRGDVPIVAHGCLGSLYLAQGDLEHAIRVLEQGLAFCRVSGHRDWLQGITADLGYAYALQGRLAEGRALIEEALSEGFHTGRLFGLAYRVAWLSEVWRLAGHGEEAWKYACQALDLARQYRERANEALALYQLGVVYAHADPPDAAQAEAHSRQALALAEVLGMRPLQAHCHLGLGTLYRMTGQREQACAALSTASEMYKTMEMTFWLPETGGVVE